MEPESLILYLQQVGTCVYLEPVDSFQSSPVHCLLLLLLLLQRYSSDSLGLIDKILPFKAAVYLFCPLHNFIFFTSFLTSSSHRYLGLPAGLPVNDFDLCILFAMLVSGIRTQSLGFNMICYVSVFI